MHRNLFSAQSVNHPEDRVLAAPVPTVEAVLFDFSNTLFRMIPIEEWLCRIAGRTGRGDQLVDVGMVAEQIVTVMELPEVAAAQVNRDISKQRYRTAMYEVFSRVDFLRGVEQEAFEEMIAPDAWLPYPDTEPVLRELRARRIPVGLVSDIAWDLQVHLEYAGLNELINSRILSYEVGREKPDPQIFLKACAELGADPRRTLMVGDNPARDGGAVAAGLRAFILAGEERTGERGLADVLRLLD